MCVDADGAAWAVPVEWTDQVELSVEREIGAGRAYVLVDDLLELAELIARVRP